jgi:hypothetical protein
VMHRKLCQGVKLKEKYSEAGSAMVKSAVVCQAEGEAES